MNPSLRGGTLTPSWRHNVTSYEMKTTGLASISNSPSFVNFGRRNRFLSGNQCPIGERAPTLTVTALPFRFSFLPKKVLICKKLLLFIVSPHPRPGCLSVSRPAPTSCIRRDQLHHQTRGLATSLSCCAVSTPLLVICVEHSVKRSFSETLR